VAGLTRDQARAFHREHFRPAGSLLVIAGDVTPERAFAAAAEWLGRWSAKGEAPGPPPPPSPSPSGVRVRIVDQPGSGCTLRLGVEVPGRSAPDEIARSVAELLFESELGQRLSRASGPGGLGRDARSSLALLRDGGLWLLGASGPADSAGTLARRLRGELRRYLASPPDAAAAATTRRAVQRSFPLRFEPLGALVGQWTAAHFCGLAADYFDTYRAHVAALTPGAMIEAARRRVDLERLSIVAVGPASTLERELRPLGSVEVVHLDQPSRLASAATEPAPPPTTEQLARGRELLDLAIAAHGGLERLKGVTTTIMDTDVSLAMQGQDIQGTMRQVRKEPYKMIYLTIIGEFTSRQVLSGDRAWTVLTGAVTPKAADPNEVAALRAGFDSDLPHLLLSGTDPRSSTAARGAERVGGRDADVVEIVYAAGQRRKLFLGTEDHRLIAVDQDEPGHAAGRPVARRFYADYRTVGGIWWPFAEERYIGGERLIALRVTSMLVNTPVGDEDFSGPGQAPHAPQK